MIAVIFENQLNIDHSEEYQKVALKMEMLVKEIPGFISFNSTRDDTGKGITVSYFRDDTSLKKWKTHPAHLLAQKLGQEKFYRNYSLKICEVATTKDWSNKGDPI